MKPDVFINESDIPRIQEVDGKPFVRQGDLQKLRDKGIIPKEASIIYSQKTIEDAEVFKQFIHQTNLLALIKQRGLDTIYIKPNFMTYIAEQGLNYTSILLLKALCDLLNEEGLNKINCIAIP